MPRTKPRRIRRTIFACLSLALLSALVCLLPSTRRSTASAQSGATLFVRKVPLKVNDVIYSPSTKMLYASVPSTAGAGGNAIIPIDPSTGTTGTPVFVGSEPDKLAISDDGNTMYVALDGAFSVRRFDVQTQTPGTQFTLGQDSTYGLYGVNDLAVSPGEPNVVAVVRYYRGTSPPEAGVAVFDNGVQRPKTGVGHISGSDYVAYSASPSKLYGGGSYDGLRTMTIDATGVASSATTTNSVGARIKVAGGLVYGSAGKVMNPDTGALLGTFSGASSSAFVPDAAAGRVYYVGYSSGTLALQAFDINTFLPVGTQPVAGANYGNATTLVRWGANGLAFITNTGDLYIIQTSLIPSSETIPTPTPTPAATPTPSPTPAATFVRQIPLTTNNLAYNPATQTVFASLPSTVAGGNSVAQIDPATGNVGAPVFVGSEPKRMAFSDDGKTMYVALGGAGAVRRFDVPTQTAGLQFSLGNDSFSGPFFPDYLAVMPGSPGTVAVNRGNYGPAVIYDDGVARQQSAGNGGPLQFGLNATRLYAGYGPIQKLSVAASGLTVAGTAPAGRAGTTYFDRARGLIFTSGGDVIDPEAGLVLGEFTLPGYCCSVGIMAVDSAAGRVYFMASDSSSGNWKILAFDMNTYLPVGSITLTGIGDTPTDLVRWGKNGLAFRTNPTYYSGAQGMVVIVQTALVDSSATVPTPTPTPAGTPTPTPTPAYTPTFVRKVGLQANDIVYNSATQSLYASVPSTAGAGGNSITPVDPSTGAVGSPAFAGSEPNRLALSDDGRTLYTSLDGAKAIRRFDLQTMTPGLQFSAGGQVPADMKVMPGSPQTLAVSPGINFSSGVTVYDDGVARQNVGKGNFYAVAPIEFGASPSVLYGYDSYSSGFELVKFNVDASGVTTASVTNSLLSGYSTDIKFANGLLYSSSGRVVNPETKTLIGTFSGASGPFAVDAALGRVFFISGDSYSGLVLKAYDMNTFLPVGQVTLQGVTGTPTRLVRWGANGLAFRVLNNSGSPPYDSSVYVVQSALVSDSQPIPTGVQLSSDKLSLYEYSSSMNVTVTRSGDVSSATTVDYSTSDGTAKAGSDYTATSGTLTFAAGELSKTFTIQLKPDNIYEGTETFNVSLSNPSGGAVLSGPSTAVVTIFDDDQRPYVSVADVRVTEGNTGTTDAQFLVTLSNPSVETVSVNYSTADGTAASPGDYASASGTLTFPPLTTSALLKVKVNGDYTVEPDETFTLNLSGAVNSTITRASATATILNDDSPGKFQFGSPTYRLAEGGGSAVITVNRAGGQTGTASINYSTSDGTATAGSDYAATSGTLTFNEGETSKTFSVPVTNDTAFEQDETINLTLSSPTGGALLGTPSAAVLTILDDDKPTFQLSDANYSVGEGDGQVTIFVTRTGDPTVAASVNYSTGDGTASEMSDYNLTLGTVRFAAGETQKSFVVLVTDDAFAEQPETFLVGLSSPVGGTLGTPATATVTINDNDAAPAPNPVGDGFDAQFFVRQHYHDFLNREPDAAGLQFWANEITSCGPDAQCREAKKVNVSAAFFLSIEFQQTGYFVYRLNQAAYNTQGGLRWRSFLADTQEIGRDVQVGVGDWQSKLDANKQDFVSRFVARPEFASAFGAMTNTQYVDALNANTFDPLAPGTGGALTQGERDQLVSDLAGGKKTRADVLRAVAENAEFSRRQFDNAFVLMQYYGYLRRNPNDAPDTDYSGYNFWLNKLNQFGGDFVQAEMVKAFISSDEYKKRFGQ